jgi:hypothetical protein
MTDGPSEVFPLLLRASAQMPATKRQTGVPLPSPRLHPCATGADELSLSCLHDPPDRPYDTDQFASDRRHCNVQLLATSCQGLIAPTQTGFGLQGDVAHRSRHPLVNVLLHLAGSWQMPICPGALHQRAPHPAIAGLGDPGASDGCRPSSAPGYPESQVDPDGMSHFGNRSRARGA